MFSDSSSGESFLKPPCYENVWVPSLPLPWKSLKEFFTISSTWVQQNSTKPHLQGDVWKHILKCKECSHSQDLLWVWYPWANTQHPCADPVPTKGPNIPSEPPHLPTFTLTTTNTGTAYKNRTELPIFRTKCFNVSARAGVKSSFWMRQHKTQNMLNSLLFHTPPGQRTI